MIYSINYAMTPDGRHLLFPDWHVEEPESIHRCILQFRPASGGTVEIENIVVDERRRGYGRELVRHLVSLFPGPPKTIYAFTRLSNDGARAFYAALGFREAAVIPRFYQDTELPDPAVLVTLEVGRG